MNIHQGLMQALGVSDQKLNNLLNQLGQYPGIMGAKISGAGLGDCIVGIGQVQLPDSMEPLSICIHEQGCLCH